MGSTGCSRALPRAAFSMWLQTCRCVWDRKKIVGDQWKKMLLFFHLVFLIHLVFKPALPSHKEKICSSAVLLWVPVDLCSQIIREVSGEETALSGPGKASQLSISYTVWKQCKVSRASRPLWLHCYLAGTENMLLLKYYIIKGDQISVGSKHQKSLYVGKGHFLNVM